MTVYPYVVVVRFTHKATKAIEEYSARVQAYSVGDAMLQALILLEAEHELTGKGYEPKVMSASPDVSTSAASDLLEEFAKRAMGA